MNILRWDSARELLHLLQAALHSQEGPCKELSEEPKEPCHIKLILIFSSFQIDVYCCV